MGLTRVRESFGCSRRVLARTTLAQLARSLMRPSGPWSVPRGPDTSCGTLIRPAVSLISSAREVPDSSSRALLRPAGPLYDSRDLYLSCGVLIHLSGSCSVPRGSGSYSGALVCPMGPDSSFGALIRPTVL